MGPGVPAVPLESEPILGLVGGWTKELLRELLPPLLLGVFLTLIC